jgi:hypothetical protein
MPAEEEMQPEEFGHEHLPPHHLSAEEKIEHLTKAYAQGKISEGLYKVSLEKFEAELEAEQGLAKEAEPEEAEKASAPKQGFIARYWMLLLGILLVLAGTAAIIMLRTNIIQVYIMGDEHPFTGIGTEEPMGHGAAFALYAIGIIMILIWGLRTKPEEDEEEDEEAPVIEAKPAKAAPRAEPIQAKPAPRVEPIQAKPAPVPRKDEKSSAYKDLQDLRPEVYKHEADHLPPHHFSPEEKVGHLTKVYAEGKISKTFFEKNLKRFEEELKREQDSLPPPHLSAREKLEHLEDAHRRGVISQTTYNKNRSKFEVELKKAPAGEQIDAEIEAAVPEGTSADASMAQLDSLLDEIKEEEDAKNKKQKKKDKFLDEIEELEEL